MPGRLWRAIMLAASIATVTAAEPRLIRAADAPPIHIAFIDVQLILRETDAAKALRSRIEAEQFSYQSELAKRENALRAASEQLSTERDGLPEADYVRRRQEIDEQVAELRRESQQRKRELEQDYNAGMDRLRATMVQVVADIAGERDVSLILNKAAVVLGATELDLTNEVVDRINAVLPTVDADAPQ
jgi:Skp family chaperone for outer membrane proteins